MLFTLEERPSDSSFVQAVWRNQSERAEAFISTAGMHWEMLWMRYKGESTLTLRGPETKATPAEVPAEAAKAIADMVQHGTFKLLSGQNHDVKTDAIAPVLSEFYGS